MCIYFTNVIIKSIGTIDELGYYSAAMSISNQCVTMIFTAMAMDYFPRLTACIGRRAEWLVTVRRQAELVALVAAPIAVSVVIAAPFVVDGTADGNFCPGYFFAAVDGCRSFFAIAVISVGLCYFGKRQQDAVFMSGRDIVQYSVCCSYLWGVLAMGKGWPWNCFYNNLWSRHVGLLLYQQVCIWFQLRYRMYA